MAHFIKLCFVFITCSYACWAAPTFREAANFYEADQFDQAFNLFDQLVSQSEKPLDKLAAEYDTAIVLAAQENWSESASILRGLLEKSYQMPKALLRNVQIALFEVLLFQADNAINTPTLLGIALDWLEEAHHLYNDIKISGCQLLKERGAVECFELSDEQPLIQWLNMVEAKVSEARRKNFFYPVSTLDSLMKVQLILLSFRSQLDNLFGLENQPSLLGIYKKKYLSQDNGFKLLLENMEKITPENDKAHLKSLKDQIFAYLEAINSNNWTAAKNKLEESEKTVDLWLDSIFPSNKEGASVLLLAAYFENALRGNYIPQNIVEILLESIKKSQISEQKKLLLVHKYIELALVELKKNKQQYARFYLEAGRSFLGQVIVEADKQALSPSNTLALSLTAQRNASKLTRMVLAAPQEIADDPVILNLLKEAQSQVLENLERFPIIVLEEQKRGFEGDGKQPGRCQHRPWDKVLPIFYKSWGTAKKAAGINLIYVLKQQEKTMFYLNDALNTLLSPLTEEEGTCYNKTPPPQGGGQKPENENEQKMPRSNIENTMREIQMMEMDDKIEKKQNVIRTGERPW